MDRLPHGAPVNHLAHTLLAGDDEALQLGGMLGDFVHGTPDPARFAPRVIDGIRLHRAIDVYTDAHAEVLAAKAQLPPPYRRYAGILLDMWFDRCLARDFSRWSGRPLAPFYLSPCLQGGIERGLPGLATG
jgi:acyl carrier protein phosphodiesterase